MLTLRSQLALVLAVPGLLWQAASSAQAPRPDSQAKPTAAPELPAPLAELAPGKAEVTYEDGRLILKARNAPLIDVLHSACALIGADLSAPEDATQPILRVIGPASAKSVLTTLLRDSSFNYTVSVSADDPNAVASVTVFPKDKPVAVTQQLSDLLAMIQAESGNSAATADSAGNDGQGSETDTGNADGGSADANQRAQELLKAVLADPALLSQFEAAAAGADHPAQPPPAAPPQPGLTGRRGRHHH
jgi:hypothetical protein